MAANCQPTHAAERDRLSESLSMPNLRTNPDRPQGPGGEPAIGPIRSGLGGRFGRRLGEGVVDVIGSDHAPHTLAEKARTYPDTPSGMPGVQTLVPIMLDHVHAGRLTLERLVALLAGNPARIFGIAGKGRIAVGCDGDFTIVDLGARRAITGDWLVGKCGWSPFLDRTVTGWPVATVVRGRVAMREGELLGPPAGAPMRFEEALRA